MGDTTEKDLGNMRHLPRIEYGVCDLYNPTSRLLEKMCWRFVLVVASGVGTGIITDSISCYCIDKTMYRKQRLMYTYRK